MSGRGGPAREGAPLSIRLWLGLALALIVILPALTTAGVYLGGTWWRQQAEQSTLMAARRVIGDDPAHWRSPAWQARARRSLAALHVDALVFVGDSQVFATTSAPLPRRPSGWQVWEGHKLTLPRGAGLAAIFVLVTPQSAILTGALAAGLLALLPALAGVGWILGRALVRPLAAMSHAAQRIAAGDLEVTLSGSRVREVAEVATALQVMSGALRQAGRRQADLERERRLVVGAVAHDLRTPLFTLRSYLGGLRDGLASTPEKAARYIEVCQQKAEALDLLIADLFAFARLEYLEQQPRHDALELGALLRGAAEGLEPRATAKDITIAMIAPAERCPLLGDAALLTRAVENLLDNALRYTPPGGRIALRWGRAERERRLVFSVEDTGPGLDDEDLPHLFTPLYRGEASRNRQTGGAGLGLAIAQRIVQAHGGDLSAASGAEGGAIFSGTLPLDAAEPPSTLQNPHPQAGARSPSG